VDIGINSAAGLPIAALSGAAIGMERQRSGHASGPAAHMGGLRTFALLGSVAGIAGLLWVNQLGMVAGLLLGSAAALVVISYAVASRRDIDATTEVAALIVIAAGFLAGLGGWMLASAIVAVTTLLLAEKSRLHQLVEDMPDPGVKAGFRFAVMALVVLPLLPKGPFGPLGGIRPRELWIVVLLLSGLSFAGYMARCLAGAGQGYLLTGILGGVVSSTNVTLTFARLSAVESGNGIALAVGVIAACMVMYVRVGVVTTLLSPALGVALLPYWTGPAICGALISVWGWRRQGVAEDSSPKPQNPLAVGAALQMAVLFQTVLFALTAVRDWFGNAGLLVSGAILGLTDVDALSISMSKEAGQSGQTETAALAVAIGCVANTVFKLAIALVVGKLQFRKSVGTGFAILLLASLASIGWIHFRS